MFNFDEKKVQKDQEIGSGAFGTVYPYKDDKQPYEMVVKYSVTPIFDTFLQNVQEIVLGFSLDHPNIVPVKGYHINFDKDKRVWSVYIMFPRMQKTLLQEFEKRKDQKKHFTEEEIRSYFSDLANGLHHLHSKMIAHRDLKPDNILILDNQAKISDIGLGRLITDGTSSIVSKGGLTAYLAPEVLEDMSSVHRSQLLKADGWSLGLIMLELCTLQTKLVNMFSLQREANLAQKRKELEGKYSSELLDLIFGLLKFNPEERISIEQVKKVLSKNAVSGNTKDNEIDELINGFIEENRVLNNQLIDLTNNVRFLTDENISLKNQIKSIKNENATLTQTNSNLITQVNTLVQTHSQINDVSTKINSLTSQVSTLTDEKNRLAEANTRLNNMINTLTHEKNQLAQTNADLTQQINSPNARSLSKPAILYSSVFKPGNYEFYKNQKAISVLKGALPSVIIAQDPLAKLEKSEFSIRFENQVGSKVPIGATVGIVSNQFLNSLNPFNSLSYGYSTHGQIVMSGQYKLDYARVVNKDIITFTVDLESGHLWISRNGNNIFYCVIPQNELQAHTFYPAIMPYNTDDLIISLL